MNIKNGSYLNLSLFLFCFCFHLSGNIYANTDSSSLSFEESNLERPQFVNGMQLLGAFGGALAGAFVSIKLGDRYPASDSDGEFVGFSKLIGTLVVPVASGVAAGFHAGNYVWPIWNSLGFKKDKVNNYLNKTDEHQYATATKTTQHWSQRAAGLFAGAAVSVGVQVLMGLFYRNYWRVVGDAGHVQPKTANPETNDCAICFDTISNPNLDLLKKCSHAASFCGTCLITSLNEKNNCPLCRADGSL